ncbi:helix-turn-helix transcriptional regulator [Paenibacillus sp. 481]|uniref:helix-turn-helix transcriptional regulator n=1 Tax=Paenibacillus sp. 481 TaxID=2835869 RepID=UPI001E2F3D81|nr:helix-turn-helix transcriptional regulator [Paenibacillus sp. 481]UHA72160.1 helix-turn-helix transcriptional regulator [Paenibacillus sp. 481]
MKNPRNWLIHHRGAKTQTEVAKMSFINRSSYCNIESGRRDPSVQVAKRIGRALHFDWKHFFEKNDVAYDELKAVFTGNKHSR